MERREALQNIGLFTGGILYFPYACDLAPEVYYSNFPLIKKEQQKLLGAICNVILPTDNENFPTPETQQHFVLTMVNDCLNEEERMAFAQGFENFKSLLPSEDTPFQDLSLKEQQNLIQPYIDVEYHLDNDTALFIRYLKSYTVLHFVTCENYMKNYLKFEFMPGRYFGSVPI